MDDTSPPPLNPRKQTSSVPFDEHVSPIQESLTTSMTSNSNLSGTENDDDDDDNVIETPLANDQEETSAARLLEEEEEDDGEEDPEAESIALARMLMEQEAIESYGALSADYLRYNSHMFSQEDLAALQAAMAEDDDEEDGGANEQPFSYDVMLRLGESIGDVKKERWNLSSQTYIDKLPTFTFDRKAAEGKDENDCDVKCLVCQFAYEDADKLLRLPCGHAFHSECASRWLEDNFICPYCRQSIVVNEE